MSHRLGRIVIRLLITLLSFVFFAVPTSAYAGDKRGGNQARERSARKACLTGDPAKGVAILSDLFIDTHDPTYLFNQGRCFEQNQRYQDALGRFEEYLRVPDANLTAEDRSTAEKHIADCKAKLPPEPVAPTVSAPPVFVPTTQPTIQSPETGARSTPQPKAEPATVARKNEPSTSSHDGSGLRVGGIVVASAGVAALAGAVLLNLKANSMVNDFETKNGAFTPSKYDQQGTYKTLAWVGYGVGGACLVTGAILFGVGLKRGSSPSSDLALLPNFGPGQTGAVLKGAF